MKVGGCLWFRDIPTRVFNRVQSDGKEKLKNTGDYKGQKTFKSVTFTNVSRSNSNVSDEGIKKQKFPNVYIEKLQGQPRGRTLEDTRVNGILMPFQIEVATNTNQTDAEIIAYVIADIMIDMGFDMIGEPIPDNSSDVYRYISRWQRLIGFGDKLKF